MYLGRCQIPKLVEAPRNVAAAAFSAVMAALAAMPLDPIPAVLLGTNQAFPMGRCESITLAAFQLICRPHGAAPTCVPVPTKLPGDVAAQLPVSFPSASLIVSPDAGIT